MANKEIGSLTPATSIVDADLFLLQQDSIAKKMTGTTLKTYAVNAVSSSVARAEAAATKIENMTVSSTTLSPGSAATVTKSSSGGVVNLAFGIPQGATGAAGTNGTNGVDGDDGEDATLESVAYSETPDLTPIPTYWVSSITLLQFLEGDYIWTKYTWSDGTISYSTTRTGYNGDNSTLDATHYATNNSPTSYPTTESDWTTTIPTVLAGEYLWTRLTWDDPGQAAPVYTYFNTRYGLNGTGAGDMVASVYSPNYTGELSPKTYVNSEINDMVNRTTDVDTSDTNYGTAMARGIYAGTTDMVAGTTALTSGVIYLYYE